MKRIISILSVLFLLIPSIIVAGEKPGSPNHTKPVGQRLVSFHEDNQRNNFVQVEHRVIFDKNDNQFILQLYGEMTPDISQVHMEVYWTFHETGELVSKVLPAYGVEFYSEWIEVTGESRSAIFEEGRSDAPITILQDFTPFNRDIRLLDIIDYSMENILDLPTHIQPWIIRDVDDDGFKELICVDHGIEDLFKLENKPHCLVIFKSMDNKWTKIDNELLSVWDTELEKFARLQKNEKRISACMSLAYSLYSHGETEILDVVEDILFDTSGYSDSKVAVLAKDSLEKLKLFLKFP